MSDIHFGTDGWRGRIAAEYTYDNVRRCTQGFASYLLDEGNKGEKVVVGYDRRFASEHFAAAAAEVLAANGFEVRLTDGAAPTPVISYSVVAQQAVGAVNITASHNPPTDNGFKVRDAQGGAIAPDGLAKIEERIPRIEEVKRLPIQEARDRKRVEVFNPIPAYVEQLGRLIDVAPIKEAGLKILVDPMWGSGAGWFRRLLRGGKTQVIEIHAERNPIFPEMTRPEPIPPNIDVALARTPQVGAQVALINDGDADRVGLGDETGRFINQLQVYALLAMYFLEVLGERGPIVKTISTTSMLNKLGKIYNVPVYETGVGFKYVAPKMIETKAMIGGEESGGYAFQGHVPERDGILAGLYLLDLMVRMGKTPSQLIDHLYGQVGPHYYDRIDRRFPADQRDQTRERIENAEPETIGGLAVTGLDMTDGFKFQLADGGWLLIRFSGTEPVIRVYCETTEEDRVQPILEDGLRIAGLEP
jgi:alpha-D-glucose phosphate-specific phosphoglucomutase